MKLYTIRYDEGLELNAGWEKITNCEIELNDEPRRIWAKVYPGRSEALVMGSYTKTIGDLKNFKGSLKDLEGFTHEISEKLTGKVEEILKKTFGLGRVDFVYSMVKAEEAKRNEFKNPHII